MRAPKALLWMVVSLFPAAAGPSESSGLYAQVGETRAAPAAPTPDLPSSRTAATGPTAGRLLDAPREPWNWLSYSGGYAGWHYSGLDQIDTSNVGNLAVSWVFQTGRTGPMAATPLVVDGILYVTSWGNVVHALDARTGRAIWTYERPLPANMPLDFACCGRINRGVAVLEDRLFLGTLDAHVVALDSRTGQVLWDVPSADWRKGYSFTGAPLVVADKVVVGVAGGEFGIRGFIDAYGAETGKRIWRFHTIPGPGAPGHETWEGDSWMRGSGPAWLTGSYDPALGLLYWGVGNPGPDLYGDDREGENLYTNSVVALDPETGKLAWHYQFTPHDVHDWDAVQTLLLIDQSIRETPRKLLVQANRNGFFYVLDRTTGTFLHAKPFVLVTWAKQIGSDGRPVLLPGGHPTPEGAYVCPAVRPGATNAGSASYHPLTQLVYVAAAEECEVFRSDSQATYRPGRRYMGGTHHRRPGDRPWGALRAIDPANGAIRWEFKTFSPPLAGTLTTAGGIVFAADMEGYVMAFHARSGKLLWRLQTGAPVRGNPISFAIDGRQHIAIACGSSLFTFALPRSRMPSAAVAKEETLSGERDLP
jgi:alcohol dehydrogenase (cytochrome c)